MKANHLLRIVVLAVIVLASFPLAASATTTIVIVPGTSDPWLAGMPAGSSASFGDVAPAQSPVLYPLALFNLGLRFSATGTTDHCTSGGCGLAGAEGDFGEGITGHTSGAENGMSNILVPIDSLIGVFLDASQPDLFTAPSTLDFSTAASRDFLTLNPLLRQVFYIGDGLRNDGITAQTFYAPAGATRLYLGTMDGFGWYNNVGELTVTIQDVSNVPEPTSIALISFGLGLAGLYSRRRS